MKYVILAAGYATRLYPLTENFPKPLLEVCGKTILDRLVDDITGESAIDGGIVVSNHRFVSFFESWAKENGGNVTIIDDGTMTNDSRLGAVKDLSLAIEALSCEDDLIVAAGDNLLDFSLRSFIRYGMRKNSSCIMRYYEPDLQKVSKSAAVIVDSDDRVMNMEEKPSAPRSHWCCPPFYYLTKDDAHLVPEAIASGCGTDAPGSFAAWLTSHAPVYAMEMPGNRYDVGTLESYERLKSTYRGITKRDTY